MLTKAEKRIVHSMLYEWSTHNATGYFDNPDQFLDGVRDELRRMGWDYRNGTEVEIFGGEGRDMVSVIGAEDDPASNSLFYIVVNWYQMRSTKWEIVAYATL